MVIANLIYLAGYEYEEAMSKGKIITHLEYQDSQAFIHQAKSLLQTLDTTKQNSTLQVSELTPLVDRINQKINNLAIPTEVNQEISLLIEQIEVITGESKSSFIPFLGVDVGYMMGPTD
jgi:protein subunit release factor A